MSDRNESIKIRIGGIALEGTLTYPLEARGLVIFAHGSGNSRFSPRNRHVADILNQAKLGTLLMDLLTESEGVEDAFTAHLRFDIPLLADRVVAVTDWVLGNQKLETSPLAYFGASTGAAAALVAAAERPDAVRAVVSRGGRPDFARASLHQVIAPTLLIVGGNDAPVIGMNRSAMQELCGQKRLEIIAGATHLFEEPGALELVAGLARDWFEKHLETVPVPCSA